MSTVLRFARPRYVFDDDMTARMGAAFDKAVVRLSRGRDVLIREAIAKHIIELASCDECDPDALAEGALAKLCRRPAIHNRPRSTSRLIAVPASVAAATDTAI
jgi:hypothetical protein